MISREELRSTLSQVSPVKFTGRVTEVCGPMIQAKLFGVSVGDLVEISLRRKNQPQQQEQRRLAQVIGYRGECVSLSPFGPTTDVLPGAKVSSSGRPAETHLGEHLLGAVVDGLGRMLQAGENSLPRSPGQITTLSAPPPEALSRQPICEVFQTGIRAIDAFCTLGRGQRIALFAEPGVGKSTLISSIAAASSADVNVIGLIGERGRELAEFAAWALPPEVRRKTVIVASTSDEPPVTRAAAASTATRIAEYFRDQGLHVLLEIDSLTRLFRAMREIGLAAGEVPVRRGYPPSVFSRLPELIERAGTARRGSITAIYTVLLSSDLDEDPMVEEVKGLTDGHLLLKRAIAESGRYPAIDILSSISRLASRLLSPENSLHASQIRSALSALQSEKELLLLSGSSSERLRTLGKAEDLINAFLAQETLSQEPVSETLAGMKRLAEELSLLKES
jgi:FliI/YscN family ATPase